MPLTKDDLRRKLLDQGENPDDFDLDSALTELNTPNTPTPASIPTRGQAFAKVGKRSILPSLIGGGAAAATLTALAPFTEGATLLPLAASAIVGAGGSYAASRGQESLLKKIEGPEKYQKDAEEYQKAREAYPVQSFATEAAPMLLQGRPSLSFGKNLVSGGGKLLTGKALQKGEKLALKEGATLAGVNTGVDVGAQTLEGGDISPGRAALAGLTGLAFTKPQLLGKTRLFGYREPQETPTVNPNATPQQLEFQGLLTSPKITPKPVEQTQPSGKIALPPADREIFGIPPKDVNPIPPKAVEESSGQQIIKPVIDQTAPPINPESAEALPPIADKITPIVPRGGFTAKQEFELKGPGHLEISRGLDKLETDKVLSPELSALLRDILYNTDDNHLAQITLKTRANLGSAGKAGAQIVGDNFYNKFMEFRKGLADLPSLKDNPRQEPLKVFLHEFAHIGYNYSHILTPAEKQLVVDRFNQLKQSGRLEYFRQGLSDKGTPDRTGTKGTGIYYYAKSPDEFIAEAFAEHVLGHRLSDESLKGVIGKLYDSFVQAIKRVAQRVGFNNIETDLRPIFEKILKGKELPTAPAKKTVSEGEGKLVTTDEGSIQPTPEEEENTFKSVEELSKLDPKSFFEKARSMEGGYTREAIRIGQKITDVKPLEEALVKARTDFQKAIDLKDIEAVGPLANKVQFFREALEAATGQGGVGEMLKKEAAKTSVKSEDTIEEGERPFITETELQLQQDRPLGLTPAKDGSLPVLNLRSKLERTVSKDEWGALKDAGIEKYLQGKSRISVRELTEWIKENGPKLEVKKLEATPTSAFAKEHFELRHWMDSQPPDIKLDYRRLRQDDTPPNSEFYTKMEEQYGVATTVKFKRLLELDSRENLTGAKHTDSATANYTMVNPKPLDKMPGAVDILVRVPFNESGYEATKNQPGSASTRFQEDRNKIKFQGHHFGGSDNNIVGWVRGYMETSPTGEKIFHVFEVQSDWASQVRKQNEAAKTEPFSAEDEARIAKYGGRTPNDPSLANYESLALKAAIQHAIKEGATKIAVSDAETAMMTEGHDRQANLHTGLVTTLSSKQMAENFIERSHIDNPLWEYEIKPNNDGSKWQVWLISKEVSQEKGMRLHYDQTLPNILKKITGDKGEVVSFGEHQNAFADTSRHPATDAPYSQGKIRDDLIFKNPQGQPKTDITARVYGLSNIKPQIESRPARMFSTHYDDIIQNESQNDSIAHETSTVIKPNSPAKEITLGPLTSSITRLEQMGGSHAIVGKAFREFFRLFSNEFEGKYVYPIVNTLTKEFRSWSNLFTKPKEWILQDNASNQRLRQYLIDMRDKGSSDIQLTPAEESKRDTIRSFFIKVREDQNSKGIPVWEGDNPRAGGFDPNWFPDIPNMAALDTVINRPHTPEGQRLIKDFIDHQNAKDRDGQKVFNEFLDSFGSAHQPNIASQYGPIDKAQGVGLPDSWREKNLVNIMARYAKRVARRFAYNDAIESSPEVRSALGIKKDPQGNDSPPIPEIQRVTGDIVSSVMRNVTGQLTRGELKRDTAGAIVRAAMLGTGTGAVDFVSNLTLGLQHSTPVQTIKSIASAWRDISSNLADSYKTGVNRLNIGSLETNANGWGEMISAGHRFRDIINELQGRNLLERYSRATAFGMGKFIAMDNLWKASRGSLGKQGRKFLDDFSPGWEQYKQSGEFPPEVLNKIAAEYTGSVQGNYDPRGLPAIAMEGSLSPFLALSRWNIEKANNFSKYVITPLIKDKNPWPFINSTIGMILGGTAVTELRKLMTGHEEKTPTKEEITEGFKEGLPNTGKALGYKMAALADASGYAGLLGNLARNVGDILFKNKPQGFTNPLIYAGSEAFDLVSDAIQALNDGEFEIGVDTIEKIIEQYVQSVRIANGVFAEVGLNPERAKELEKSNKMRNLRMYNNLAGYPVNEISQDKPNPFTNLNARSYKQSSDLQESSDLLNKEILPALVQKYKGNPELLRSKLSGLAQNSYQTIPSPEISPLKTAQYLQNQQSVRGQSYKDSLVQDYLRQKLVNSIKSSAVPRL